MAKARRFRVESLDGVHPGDALILPPDEIRHVRVLRLHPGDDIELFDAVGRTACAVLANPSGELAARIVSKSDESPAAPRLLVASAWPKGKRAAMLVEKCAELGLDRLIPVRYARSVVTKDDETEGVARLRRIAIEAGKQCGRNSPLEIDAEVTFEAVLEREAASAIMLLAHPGSERDLLTVLRDRAANNAAHPVLIFIGPEGGFTEAELATAQRAQVQQIKLASNVLRIETAVMAACAITRAFLEVG